MSVLDKMRNDILLWTEARRSRWGGYGRFKFAMSSGRSCLSASLIALLDIYDYFNVLGSLSSKQRSEWIQYLQSFQDKTSGRFIDKKNRRGISDVDWNAVADYDTARSFDALSLFWSSPLYAIANLNSRESRKVFSADVLYDWIRELDWGKSPWGASTALQQIVAIMQEVHPEDLRQMVEAVKEFIYSTQKPETGLWGNDNCGLDQQGSAAYKMIIILGELGLEVPKREPLFGIARRWFFDSEKVNMCIFRNSLCLLVETMVDRSGDPLRMKNSKSFRNGILRAVARDRYYKDDELILRIIDRAFKQLDLFRAPDGGFSFYPGRSTSHHNGVILCKGRQEGDFLAASNVSFFHACISSLVSMLGEQAFDKLEDM